MAALEASLSEFELVEPLVWNKRSGYILGGHQRLAVLRKRGAKQVDVSVVDLDETRELALMAVLNKPAGEFTPDVDGLIAGLGAELRKSLGLDALLNGGRGPKSEVVEDVAPAPPKKPVSKTGDLWLLGDHRILCGDSTKAEDVTRVMNGRRAVLMATDPPYGVDYANVLGGRENQKVGGWREIVGDNLDDAGLFALVKAALSLCAAPTLFLWHSWKRVEISLRAVRECGWRPVSEIVWVKNALVFGRSDCQWRHECCIYAKRDGAPSQDDRTATTVWEFPKPTGGEHPTAKPTGVFAIPIRNHTKAGEIVYEPFSGSGTQIVAAEQLGRKCYAIEIAPAYVDVAVVRWQKLTGKKATHEKTGKPFGG